MSVLDWLLGKRLSTLDEDQHQIGPLAGIPILGLDALSSAAYGPEAALTVLIPLGAAGLNVIGPLSGLIVAVLLIVFVSYRQRGRRLVFSLGIISLATLAGGLLVGFGGVTDRLIPLFAIGALLAFTLSQAGMVLHWRRNPGQHSRRSACINGLGACATGLTLLVVAVSKFVEGAWLVVAVIPGLAAFFGRVHGHYQRIAAQIATIAPLEIPDPQSPIVVVPAASWNRMTQHGLRFALRLSTEVHVVQVKTETDSIEDLSDNWELLIASRARAVGIQAPRLVRLTSEHRRFFKPFVDYVLGLERANPQRDIVVVIPDVILTHWYEGLLHNNRGAFLRSLLRSRGGPRLVIVDVPFHIDD